MNEESMRRELLDRAAEVCGYPNCGHTLAEHSEDGYCWTCSAVSTSQGAHAFQTQPSPSQDPLAERLRNEAMAIFREGTEPALEDDLNESGTDDENEEETK